MIEIKNIHKTYTMGEVDVKALDGVSLKIAEGEFVAIMGASGSGKSTLMHVLGLLDRPDSGEYYLQGKEVTSLSDEELAVVRNGLIGFVFQQFHLLPRMSALENAELPLIYAGKRHLRARAEKELAEVGLQDRISHRPSELSGGQQQRVAIARSLVNDPVILLADEPTGNLDSKSKAEIMAILKDLNARGKTVVVVTHEPEVAGQARRVIQMRDGRIISDERVRQAGAGTTAAGRETGSFVNEILHEHHSASGKIKFVDYVRQAMSAMVSHKMRSLLSILGILIGVAAVIAMLALGSGAKASIEQQLASLGSNLLWIHASRARTGGVAVQATVTRFTKDTVNAVAQQPSVKRVYGSVSSRGQVVYGSNNVNTQIEGVDVAYAPMRASVPSVGRFFTEQEVRNRDKVAVLGTTAVTNLFGNNNPVGETIKINLINFKVIGILPTKGGGGFRDQDDIVIIPLTTAMYRVLGKQYIDNIYAEAVSADAVDEAQEEITQALIKHHRIRGKNINDAFDIRNMSDIKSTLESTMHTLTMLLGSIAAISLLVGGIGIMNIMLVSVTERTREIGLRKAIGANNKDIMVQFLIEAVLMSFIGGVAGIVIGVGASSLMKIIAGWAVKVSASSIFLSTAFSLMVGIVFGLWPAQKASQLNPIDALRYE
ncbi:MAG: ABC transporter permease [Candidatus Omnitrophica bacterium]|nr:ABC transporter permease [Candidatus Omnitrophota bacterium]MDD5775669.1 ABC transporter permease [Candidatus Omnitrophota bacterium]